MQAVYKCVTIVDNRTETTAAGRRKKVKTFSKLLLILLAACMALSLCACGDTSAGDTQPPTGTEEPTPTGKPVDDGKVTYTVTVTDENGDPVVGAVVQLCEGSTCKPAATDADGKAMYRTAEADYKVSVTQAPEGYAADETEYHFEEGSYELTITLKAEPQGT